MILAISKLCFTPRPEVKWKTINLFSGRVVTTGKTPKDGIIPITLHVVESPMYKNFPTRPDIIIPPPVPEEYEVPVKTATSRSMSAQLDGDHELVVPTEYEVPVSSLP